MDNGFLLCFLSEIVCVLCVYALCFCVLQHCDEPDKIAQICLQWLLKDQDKTKPTLPTTMRLQL